MLARFKLPKSECVHVFIHCRGQKQVNSQVNGKIGAAELIFLGKVEVSSPSYAPMRGRNQMGVDEPSIFLGVAWFFNNAWELVAVGNTDRF